VSPPRPNVHQCADAAAAHTLIRANTVPVVLPVQGEMSCSPLAIFPR
jgi:hypothetical protein